MSFEPRKGVWPELLSSERMHSFRHRRLLLISAPSRRVVRSLEGLGLGVTLTLALALARALTRALTLTLTLTSEEASAEP